MDIEKSSKNIVKESLELTDVEKDIFEIFTNFVQEKNLKTTLRVTGGWVRDKARLTFFGPLPLNVTQVVKENVFYWQVENPTLTIDDLKVYIGENKEKFLKNRF